MGIWTLDVSFGNTRDANQLNHKALGNDFLDVYWLYSLRLKKKISPFCGGIWLSLLIINWLESYTFFHQQKYALSNLSRPL